MDEKTMYEDALRRKAMNEADNPRETVMNEATQTINPITGKAYFEKSKSNQSIYSGNEAFFNYQRKLAEMDVRDGKKASGQIYIGVVANKLIEAGLPLTSISSPEGLDSAIAAMEAQAYVVWRLSKENYDFEGLLTDRERIRLENSSLGHNKGKGVVKPMNLTNLSSRVKGVIDIIDDDFLRRNLFN